MSSVKNNIVKEYVTNKGLANESAVKNYPAKHYQSSDNDRPLLIDIINRKPLATLIFTDNGTIDISHIPCHFAHNKNNELLIAHVSNHHGFAKKLQGNSAQNIQLIFHGEDAYISPNDVAPQNKKAQMVPTWNYAKVHISGIAHEVKDDNEKYKLMSQSSDYFERYIRPSLEGQKANKLWKLTDAPDNAIKTMLNAITLFTIVITNMEGRLKLSQNKSKEVKQQIAQQLTIRGENALAQMMDKV